MEFTLPKVQAGPYIVPEIDYHKYVIPTVDTWIWLFTLDSILSNTDLSKMSFYFTIIYQKYVI